jgi:hypothetical protein
MLLFLVLGLILGLIMRRRKPEKPDQPTEISATKTVDAAQSAFTEKSVL